MQAAIKVINELVEVSGKPEWELAGCAEPPTELGSIAKVNELAKRRDGRGLPIHPASRSARHVLSSTPERVIGQLTKA